MRALALRLVLAAGVLLGAAVAAGEALVRPALPLLGAGFAALAPDFRLLRLDITEQGGQQRLAAQVTLARLTVVGARVVHPDPRGVADVVTPMAHALHLPLLAACLALAWPAAAARELLLRLLPLTLVLLVLVPLDTPAVLAAEIRKLLLDVHAPGSWDPLVAWSAFLLQGGRALLAALAAALAVGTAGALSRFRA